MQTGLPSAFSLFTALVILAPAVGAVQEGRPFDVQGMLEMERVSDPVVSPDGTQVLYTLSSLDLAANRRRTDLWIANLDGSGSRRLTSDPASDGTGRFSPDGKRVYFLSSRSGSSQVWAMDAAGGEARALTDLPLDVLGMALFPDDERLLLCVDVYPEFEKLEQTAERVAAEAAAPVQARAYETLLARHWDTWEDGRRQHLIVLRPSSGEWTDLMAGLNMDAPGKPFGGFDDVAIAPDGSHVVFAAKEAAADNAWSTDLDLWMVAVDGRQPPVCLTANRPGAESSPVFSPDGRTLAYLSMPRAGYEADRRQIVLRDRNTGEESLLAADWDRSPGEIVFAPDGSALLATADHLGNHALFSVALNTSEVRPVVERGNAAAPRPLIDGVVFLHDDLKRPAELQWSRFDGSQRRALTDHNGTRLKELRFGDYEQFTFSGAKGDTVHAYLVRPVDFDGAKKYPVAFLIHGGPQGSFGDRFHYRWNPQIYAGAGYAAIMVDFHGSTGYGQAFTDAIRGDWGGAPFEDLMAGLDAALGRFDYLDGTRVAALGASYGGYMINWIAGQAPDRFRALVNHDGIVDTRMFWFDTEELWFPEWEFGGLPWQNAEGYARHNPALHVGKWKTPMLVIQGAKDFRVVETQALATFTALQRQGIPSRFLYFPDENHWVIRPQNSVRWHAEVLDWLSRHMGVAGDR